MDNSGKANKRLMRGKPMYNLTSSYIPLYLSSDDGTIVVGEILAPECEHFNEQNINIPMNSP